MLYEDITDERLRKKAIAIFLRTTVPVLLKAPSVKTVPLSTPIKLTKEEQEAVNERMAEFYEHDR